MWCIVLVVTGAWFIGLALWLRRRGAFDRAAATTRARGRLVRVAQARRMPLPPEPDADLLVERSVWNVDSQRWRVFLFLGIGFLAAGVLAALGGGGILATFWCGMTVVMLGLLVSQVVQELRGRRAFAASRRIALLRRQPMDAVLPRHLLVLEGISLLAVVATLLAPASNTGGPYRGASVPAIVVGGLAALVGVAVIAAQLRIATTASALGTPEGLLWDALDRADIVSAWRGLLMTSCFGVLQLLQDSIQHHLHLWKVVSLLPVLLVVSVFVDTDGSRRRARIQRRFLGTPA